MPETPLEKWMADVGAKVERSGIPSGTIDNDDYHLVIYDLPRLLGLLENWKDAIKAVAVAIRQCRSMGTTDGHPLLDAMDAQAAVLESLLAQEPGEGE